MQRFAVLSALALAVLLAPAPARADEPRAFCADRPGLGTPPCTLAPGTAMVELGLAGWDHASDAMSVDDDIALGDLLLRVGVTETTEIQFGLTSHVIQRSRDRASGARSRVSGIGDGTVALRQSLNGPDGNLAVQVYATVPIAPEPIGTGRWAGGVLLPMAFSLPGQFELGVTPQLELAANAARGGHHLAWGGVVGLSHLLGEHLGLTVELGAFRDDDPDGKSTDARLAASLAWQVAEHVQFDFEADAGLSHGAPDRLLAVGLAWQFR